MVVACYTSIYICQKLNGQKRMHCRAAPHVIRMSFLVRSTIYLQVPIKIQITNISISSNPVHSKKFIVILSFLFLRMLSLRRS